MNVGSLKAAVSMAKEASPRSTPLEILKMVRLKGDGQMLSVMGGNMTCEIEADAGVGIGPINACIDPDKLLNALDGRDEAEIRVGESSMMVKAGGGRFKVPFFHVSGRDFPVIDVGLEKFDHIEVDGLVDAIKSSAFAVSPNDISRPFLRNVCVRTIDGRLVVCAANHVYATRTDVGEREEPLLFCVPREAAIGSFTKAAVHVGKEHMRLDWSDARLTTKITASYGDIESFFTVGDLRLTCSAKELIDAVTRVTRFGSVMMIREKAVSFVRISVTDDGVLVSSPADDAQEIVAGSGDRGDHNFNASALMQLLSRCGDSVDMAWRSGATAARVFVNDNWRGAIACVSV